jgi:GrpB-like predicted nucleotidyltransferase (UPF0157 family)
MQGQPTPRQTISSLVTIVDYDSAWPEIFEALREELVAVLGDLVVTVEHVGSTAVPGLAAKPIVDIDVVVQSPADLTTAIERLCHTGYVHQGDLGIPGREAFTTPRKAPPHHLYVVTANNLAYRHHILFRDYLRRHPDEARAYSELKQVAAERFRDDRVAYTSAKDRIIGKMVRRAEEEEHSYEGERTPPGGVASKAGIHHAQCQGMSNRE